MPSGTRRIVCIVRPSVNAGSLRMVNIEYLDVAFPDCLTLKRLFHWHGFNVRRLYAMQLADYVSEFVDVVHDAAFTKSATLQKSLSIPANIAGVILSDPCVRTRL